MENKILRDRREQKSKTQTDMAKVGSISLRAYQMYEYGTRVPNARTAILIARALNTTVEELWGLNPIITGYTFSVAENKKMNK